MTTFRHDVTLASGDCRAVVTTRGGGPRHLSLRGRDLLEGYGGPGQPDTAPLSANVVLAPWPNRTRDGEYTLDGEVHRLTVTEPDRATAIHGFVADLEWTVTDRGTDTVTLVVDPGPQPGWPWPVHLEMTYRADPAGLAAEFLLRNLSDARIPAACGFHLYPSALGAATDDCTLTTPSHTVLPLDDRKLPCGPEQPDHGVLPGPVDALAGRLLDDCLHLTDGTAGDSGDAEFVLQGPDGTGVVLRTSPELRWAQVFTPADRWGAPYPGRPDGRAVAVEPMTAPPDALNSGTDLALLGPGETLTCGWSIRVLDG